MARAPHRSSLPGVTAIDWLIVAFCLLLALYGYAQGFIVGIMSLVGFVAGALIGTRLAPLLLSGGSHSQYAPLFGLLGAYLLGCRDLQIDFKKGALLRVDVDRFHGEPRGVLKWMLIPKLAGA